jgi:hypothetical protein
MGGFLAVYKAERAPEPNPVQAPHRAASSPEAKRVPRLLHTPGALPWPPHISASDRRGPGKATRSLFILPNMTLDIASLSRYKLS